MPAIATKFDVGGLRPSMPPRAASTRKPPSRKRGERLPDDEIIDPEDDSEPPIATHSWRLVIVIFVAALMLLTFGRSR